MPTTRPNFSVVIPTYNRSKLVRRAVASVLGQSYRDFEVVVVDDGSMDDTVTKLESISDERLRVISQENAGRSAARNAGAQEARGEYLVFLDSDDEAKSDWLARFNEHTGADVICCGAEWYGNDGKLWRTTTPQDLGDFYHNLTMQIRGGAFAIRSEHFLSLGGYVDGLELCEHTELAARIADAAAAGSWRIDCTDEPLVIIHDACQSMSRNADDLPETIEVFIAHHQDKFARVPRKLVDYLNIAGVNAAKKGDLPKARGYFWSAAKTLPLRPHSWVRLSVASLPAIAKRVWPNRHRLQ